MKYAKFLANLARISHKGANASRKDSPTYVGEDQARICHPCEKCGLDKGLLLRRSCFCGE